MRRCARRASIRRTRWISRARSRRTRARAITRGSSPADSPDPRVEVVLEGLEHGTRVTVIHEGIPEGQRSRYESGWINFYFKPMERYFAAAPALPSSPEEEAMGSPGRRDLALEAAER